MIVMVAVLVMEMITGISRRHLKRTLVLMRKGGCRKDRHAGELTRCSE